MEFLIETGIEIPPTASKQQYPTTKMRVGDSIYVPETYKKVSQVKSYFYNLNMQAKKKDSDTRFKVVKFDEGCRVWRIS